MTKKEKLAQEYAEQNNSSYTNDCYGFMSGYEAKEEQIRKYIRHLERTIAGAFDNNQFSSKQEQIEYVEKVNETRKVLKSLLDE